MHMEMKDEFLFKTHMLDKNGERKESSRSQIICSGGYDLQNETCIGHGTAGAYLNCTGAGREI